MKLGRIPTWEQTFLSTPEHALPRTGTSVFLRYRMEGETAGAGGPEGRASSFSPPQTLPATDSPATDSLLPQTPAAAMLRRLKRTTFRGHPARISAAPMSAGYVASVSGLSISSAFFSTGLFLFLMHGWKVLVCINVHFKKKDFIIHSEKETERQSKSEHKRGVGAQKGQQTLHWAGSWTLGSNPGP